jgi:hypothetical protein
MKQIAWRCMRQRCLGFRCKPMLNFLSVRRELMEVEVC